MTGEPETLRKSHLSSDDDKLFEQLKDVLLKEDREELQRLRTILDTPEKLSAKMSPVFEEHLRQFKKDFPEDYHAIINRMISEKLANSKEELLEAIYPVMGRMIKKYIILQFRLLQEAIDRKLKTGIWFKIKSWFRSKFTGVKQEDIILSEIGDYTIENVIIIQKDSGLLIASAKNNPDDDLVAGMMTAIKSFAEDAFGQDNAELEQISYGEFTLLLENYYTYYFVVAVKGTVSARANEAIQEKMNTFASRELIPKLVQSGRYSLALSIKLRDAFLIK